MSDTPERVWIKDGYYSWGQYGHWYAHIKVGGTEYAPANHIEQLTATNKELEGKLAKAVKALELALELADNGLVDFSRYGLSCDADINKHYRTTLAELSSVSCANSKGQDDE